jgi:hypothetical protein
MALQVNETPPVPSTSLGGIRWYGNYEHIQGIHEDPLLYVVKMVYTDLSYRHETICLSTTLGLAMQFKPSQIAADSSQDSDYPRSTRKETF